MAKISTYTFVDIPTLGDYVIGTVNTSSKETKNFRISDFLSLFGEYTNYSYGLFAQTDYSVAVVPASGEASLIGPGVGSLSVPANTFSIGDSFTGKMCGILTCANNETIHIRIKSNGIVIIDLPTFNLAISTNKFWDLILDFTIREIGPAGTASLAANGVFTYNKNSNFSLEGKNFGLISDTLFDTTVENELTITAEWVSTSTSNTIRSQNFTLTKIY